MPSHKYTVIILKKINLGEADRIVTAFSKEKGKIKFVAKGTRRTKSKLAGSIESFCQSRIMLSDGKNLDILTSAEIIHNYLGLKPELINLKTVSYICEVIDKLMIDNQANDRMFELLHKVFSRLDFDNDKLKIYFLTQFFSLSGVNPETNTCVRCGEKPENYVYFSCQAGGILDDDCATYYSDGIQIGMNTAKTLVLASSVDLDSFLKVTIPQANIDEADNLLSKFFTGNLP